MKRFLGRWATDIYPKGNNLHSFISVKEIEFVIKIPFYKENVQSRCLHWQVLQTFKEEIMPVLNNLLGIEKEGTISNSIQEFSITLMPKPDKDNIRAENYRPITHKYKPQNP